MTYKVLVRDQAPGKSPGPPRLIYASDSKRAAQAQLDRARDILRVTGTGNAYMLPPPCNCHAPCNC